MPEEGEGLDSFINELEEAIETSASYSFTAGEGLPPRPCNVIVHAESVASREARRSRPAELYMLRDGQARIRSRQSLVRGQEVEIHIQAEKSGDGEVIFHAVANVAQAKRIPGCYDVVLEIIDIDREEVPAHRRLLECAVRANHAAWNRWCAELTSGPVLRSMDLPHMDLANFDFCCADLTGSDLSGANLSGANLSGANLSKCMLDGVRVAGADMFRVTIPRRYLGLVSGSGLVEIESVVLADE